MLFLKAITYFCGAPRQQRKPPRVADEEAAQAVGINIRGRPAGLTQDCNKNQAPCGAWDMWKYRNSQFRQLRILLWLRFWVVADSSTSDWCKVQAVSRRVFCVHRNDRRKRAWSIVPTSRGVDWPAAFTAVHTDPQCA